MIAIPADTSTAFRAICNAVRSGEISEARIDNSVLRILRAKEAIGLDKQRLVNLEEVQRNFANAQDFKAAQESADKAVTLVRNSSKVLPLTKAEQASSDPGALVFVILKNNLLSDAGQAFQASLQSRVANSKIFVVDPTVANNIAMELLQAARNARKVIVTAFVAHTAAHQELINGTSVQSFGLFGPSRVLMTELLSESANKTAVIAAGNPYLIENFPNIETYLCTFSTSPTSDLAALKAILGDRNPSGKLPIDLPHIAARGTSLSW